MAVNPEPGSGGFAAPGQKGVGSKNAQKNAPAAGPNVAGNAGSPCLISSPSLPLVGSVGGGCILSKTNVRAMLGGLIFGAGSVVTVAGLALLAAAGFSKTKLGQQAANAVSLIPGAEVAGTALRSGVTAAASQSRSSRASSERRQMRQLGEPKENRNLRTGRGAVRESPAGTRERKRTASREEAGF